MGAIRFYGLLPSMLSHTLHCHQEAPFWVERAQNTQNSWQCKSHAWDLPLSDLSMLKHGKGAGPGPQS